MGPGHPECPERLDAIEDRLLVTGVGDALERFEAPEAALADIELAHDRMHVAALRGMSDRLNEELMAGGPNYAQLDTDTSINAHTWKAALRAAGAALAATDAVMAGELENAFCAVRPPGHHATRSKAMGFCFFNNVAVAAKYALQRYNLHRVAVVDFDVHHGNGTEDILAGDSRALMVSIFQHPFYPYSGDVDPAPNMVNVPVAAYTRGMDIREIIEMMWIPRLEAFKPEMIFVSAGFDAPPRGRHGPARVDRAGLHLDHPAHQGHGPPLFQGAHRFVPGGRLCHGPAGPQRGSAPARTG